MSCDIAIVYFWTVISVVASESLRIKNGIRNGAERLSVFAAVASEVVASLASKYEHLCAKWRNVVIFNPRHACAARVTGIVLCVCVCVCVCVSVCIP